MKFFKIESLSKIINIDAISYFDEKVINFIDGGYIRIYTGIYYDLIDFIAKQNNEK